MEAYTLKILFGPLYGCELHLPANDYFLATGSKRTFENVNESSESSDSVASYTKNMLHIPCNTPSPNILLHLSKYIEGKGFKVDVQGIGNNSSVFLNVNELFSHGSIHFAIKRTNEEWSDSILFFGNSAGKNTAGRNGFNLFYSLNNSVYTLIFLLTLSFITLFFLWGNKDNGKHMSSLNEYLSDAPTPLNMVLSRDKNVIYVLGSDYQSIKWAREALPKSHEKKDVILVWTPQVYKELIAKLNSANYPILQIDRTFLQHPIVKVYRSLTDKEEADIKKIVLNNIKYAFDVNIMVKNKSDLLSDSREGLDQLNVTYHIVKTSNNYAFIIHANLSDTNINNLHNFINDFHDRWGTSIVKFSVIMRENGLQGKSYFDSRNGYIALNPNHLLFTSSNK